MGLRKGGRPVSLGVLPREEMSKYVTVAVVSGSPREEHTDKQGYRLVCLRDPRTWLFESPPTPESIVPKTTDV